MWRRYLYERAGDGPREEGLQPIRPCGLLAIRICNCLVAARTQGRKTTPRLEGYGDPVR
jgi:hypothetical protein